ncbi:MAG: uroporphyrinogen decarboxylase [Anaerolineae bacterium]|nr:uroporphyrinogen decarboxylase [Anaerolineae bacterium]
MTRRERVAQAVAHERPDRVPWHIALTIPAAQRLSTTVGIPASELPEWMQSHLYYVEPLTDDAWQEVRPGHWRDEYGVVWNRTVDPDIGVIEEFQLQDRSLGDLRLPDPRDSRRWEDFERRLERRSDRYTVCSIGFSLFERAWTLRGMTNLLMDMVEAPAFVDHLMDVICEHNLKLVERAVTYDIDAVYFGDDWGQQRGLIMGPKHWRRFVLPRIQRMYGAVKAAGKRVFIHSCGDVREVFGDLIEAGLDVFNPFQPEVMDVYEVKRLHGDRLAFLGGMSIQRVMPFGTADEVRQEARTLMERIGAGGGYILSPSHDIPKDVPVENIIALVETVRDQQP